MSKHSHGKDNLVRQDEHTRISPPRRRRSDPPDVADLAAFTATAKAQASTALRGLGIEVRPDEWVEKYRGPQQYKIWFAGGLILHCATRTAQAQPARFSYVIDFSRTRDGLYQRHGRHWRRTPP